MKQDNETVFRTHYEGSEESLQLSLLALKQIGCTQVETVKVLISVLGLSLQEADVIVLNSTAWEAEKDDTLKLRDNFGRTLSE
jgi:hypothetical protein